MNERDFLNWVIACAENHRWKVWHVPAPMVAGGNEWRPYKRAAGLPDLFMLHEDPARMIIAEVKGHVGERRKDGTQRVGKLSDAQREFLRLARAVAHESFSWEDADLEQPHGSPIGVYVFEPGMQDVIEQMLRTRVLT